MFHISTLGSLENHNLLLKNKLKRAFKTPLKIIKLKPNTFWFRFSFNRIKKTKLIRIHWFFIIIHLSLKQNDFWKSKISIEKTLSFLRFVVWLKTFFRVLLYNIWFIFARISCLAFSIYCYIHLTLFFFQTKESKMTFHPSHQINIFFCSEKPFIC